jgi:hypothetical protein
MGAADYAKEKTQELERDGFVFFRQFFPEELARQAYEELRHWYEIDDADREKKNVRDTKHCGSAGTTVKTAPSHLLIDAYGKSPALDKIVNHILTHEASTAVLRRLAGEHIKFRGYNVRLMTGSYDPGPYPNLPTQLTLPHDWHRDSHGEFGIGIFLSDVPDGGNGGTALMRGSHKFPYCPRWNTLLNSFWYATRDCVVGSRWFARLSPFNRLLGRLCRKRAVEATGTPGDFYFFLNDVWHGRYPNVHGRKTMIVLIGAFPTEFPFPDEVKTQPRAVIDKLPVAIQKGLVPQPENSDRSSYFHQMLAARRKPFPLGLFFMARMERLFANRATPVLREMDRLWKGLRRRIGKVVRGERQAEPASSAK